MFEPSQDVNKKPGPGSTIWKVFGEPLVQVCRHVARIGQDQPNEESVTDVTDVTRHAFKISVYNVIMPSFQFIPGQLPLYRGIQ